MRNISPLLALVLLLSLGGCGPLEADRPLLVLDPERIVLPGDGSGAALTISNLGDGPLQLDAVELSSDAVTLEGCRAPLVLQPFDSCSSTLSARQALDGSTVQLRLASDDPWRPEVRLPISRVASAADLVPAAAAVDFGDVTSGETAQRVLTVRNEGGRSAGGLMLRLPMGSDFAAHTTAQGLAPGETAQLWLSYTPQGGDSDQARLELVWDQGQREVTLMGRQALQAPH